VDVSAATNQVSRVRASRPRTVATGCRPGREACLAGSRPPGCRLCQRLQWKGMGGLDPGRVSYRRKAIVAETKLSASTRGPASLELEPGHPPDVDCAPLEDDGKSRRRPRRGGFSGLGRELPHAFFTQPMARPGSQ